MHKLQGLPYPSNTYLKYLTQWTPYTEHFQNYTNHCNLEARILIHVSIYMIKNILKKTCCGKLLCKSKLYLKAERKETKNHIKVFKDSEHQECLLLVRFYCCALMKNHQWGSVLTILQAHVRSATPNTIAVKSNLETLQNRTWQLSHKAPVIFFVRSYLRSFILLNCNTSSYHLFLTYYLHLNILIMYVLLKGQVLTKIFSVCTILPKVHNFYSSS